LVAERAKHDAELSLARAEADRVKAAQAKAPDLITPQAVDIAAARLALAEAARAKNETMLQYARLTAPFGGVVTMRYVDQGAFVPAATGSGNPAAAAVVALADYSVVRAVVPVPEIEAARVAVGQPIILTTDALAGQTFRGTVSRHTGALDESTRTLAVEADIPNREGLLRPGMYVSAKLGVELHRGALLVPASALVKEKVASYVFVLTDGKANRVQVKAGFNDGASVEILDGIADGARVVIPGKAALVSGQAVTAVEVK